MDLELEAAYQRMADKAVLKDKLANEFKARIDAKANGLLKPMMRFGSGRKKVSTPEQLAYKREYYQKNREKCKAYSRQHYKDNRERYMAYQLQYWRMFGESTRKARKALKHEQ